MPTATDIIEDKHLGAFKRTGVRRVPVIGEYYWCERVIGIGLCTQKNGPTKEILEPLSKPKTVHIYPLKGV